MPDPAIGNVYLLGTSSATVTTGTGTAYDCGAFVRDIVFYVKGSGTISAGTLVFEEADDTSYANTWSQVGSSVDCTALTGGAMLAVHVNGCFRAVRPRLTANVTGSGGGITVQLAGC